MELTLLELFAGSRSVGKEAEKIGFKVFSVDIESFENIDYQTDILNFNPKKVPFKPLVIWASPPCTTFSVMSLGKYWTHAGKPKNEKAILNASFVSKTIEIINHFKPKYWFIENPRGKLRKLHIINPLGQWPNYNRQTVTYCQYGFNYMKPTDIFNNNLNWKPKPKCKPRAKCHISNIRSQRFGLQGVGDNLKDKMARKIERSKIPPALCREILNACLI